VPVDMTSRQKLAGLMKSRMPISERRQLAMIREMTTKEEADTPSDMQTSGKLCCTFVCCIFMFFFIIRPIQGRVLRFVRPSFCLFVCPSVPVLKGQKSRTLHVGACVKQYEVFLVLCR